MWAVLVLLAACGGSPPADTGVTPLPRPKPVPPDATASPTAAPTVPPSTALTPLPTPQQVIQALPVGRRDPFAPPPVAVAKGPAASVLPAGFRFTGVIVAGGEAQALVQLGGLSGSLRVGDRGARDTDLLPAGWSVARIDGRRRLLTLRQGRRTLALEL